MSRDPTDKVNRLWEGKMGQRGCSGRRSSAGALPRPCLHSGVLCPLHSCCGGGLAPSLVGTAVGKHGTRVGSACCRPRSSEGGNAPGLLGDTHTPWCAERGRVAKCVHVLDATLLGGHLCETGRKHKAAAGKSGKRAGRRSCEGPLRTRGRLGGGTSDRAPGTVGNCTGGCGDLWINAR